MTDPWTYSKGLTLGFGWTALEMIERVEAQVGDANFPFLIVHCDNDMVTPLRGSELMIRASKSASKELKVYTNCYHSPLTCGEEKAKSSADTLSWVKQRFAK